MAFAQLQNSPTKYGRGRFTVSEGIAPSEHILPDEDLATLMQGDTGAGDEFFEVVLVQGTIISSYQKTDGRYVATYCRGLDGTVLMQKLVNRTTGAVTFAALDTAAPDQATTFLVGAEYVRAATTAITNVGGTDGVVGSLGQAAQPLGVLFMDAFRPFGNSDGSRAQGDNAGVSFITHGYVEWPLCTVATSDDNLDFDNTDLVVGDYVKPDGFGRPVKFIEGVDPEFLRIGHVIAREDLGATGPGSVADYDYGMLNYMQLPIDIFDRALVSAAYTTSGIFGVKPNLASDDAAAVQAYHAGSTLGALGCIGAVRVNLMGM
jgi:hypothetical protein